MRYERQTVVSLSGIVNLFVSFPGCYVRCVCVCVHKSTIPLIPFVKLHLIFFLLVMLLLLIPWCCLNSFNFQLRLNIVPGFLKIFLLSVSVWAVSRDEVIGAKRPDPSDELPPLSLCCRNVFLICLLAIRNALHWAEEMLLTTKIEQTKLKCGLLICDLRRVHTSCAFSRVVSCWRRFVTPLQAQTRRGGAQENTRDVGWN